jgi:hypothetical protein
MTSNQFGADERGESFRLTSSTRQPMLQYASDVQIFDIEGIVFNELAAGFHIFAH